MYADTFTFQSGNSTSRTDGHSRTMPRCALWGPKILLEAVAGGRVEAFISRGLSVRVNPSLETRALAKSTGGISVNARQVCLGVG